MTTELRITANLDIDPWADLLERVQSGQIDSGDWTRIGILPTGMSSGRASVAVVVTLPDGRAVIGQTSLRNFLLASTFVAATPVAQMEDL